MRPPWDTYFLQIATLAATRATCNRLHVGAVLVRDKRILATGYNGSPSGMPHCDDVGHLLMGGHCIRTIHAEHNALLQAKDYGISTIGATCYSTHNPCRNCANRLIEAGVVRIVYAAEYADEMRDRLLAKAGITVEWRGI